MKWREIPKEYNDKAKVLSGQKPHEILQVSDGASLLEVKAAYRRLVKLYHPDKSHEFMRASNAEVMRIINEAYETLSRRAASPK
jgi:DnaJ-class molecular chaperone